MTLLDFLSPVRRNPLQWLSAFGSSVVVLVGLYLIVPPVEKHTMFFSVKPVASAEQSFVTDGVESAEKIAEMISGWAKDPNFQQAIIRESGIKIPGLKRKMAARKQNRLNVFWTLKLSGAERAHGETVTTVIQQLLTKKIAENNEDSVIPIKITTPQITMEPLTIPLSWVIIAITVIAFIFATLISYVRDSIAGRISFIEQIESMFPYSALLRVDKKAGQHDIRLINDFTSTFHEPRMISTFPVAGKYFEVSKIAECDTEEETPILLVQMGKTSVRELQNMKAIFGDEIGIIVFEK